MTTKSSICRVAVLVGGPSPEHEISLLTGQQIQRALQTTIGYNADLVYITREGLWTFAKNERVDINAALQILQRNYDIAFLALHGSFGEDGTVQGALESSGIPYTGSNVLASSIAINKKKTKQVLLGSRPGELFAIPDDVYVERRSFNADSDSYIKAVCDRIGFPCVVKPNCLGSSYGTSIVHARENLEEAIRAAVALDSAAIVEPYLRGREVTCGIMEKLGVKFPEILPLPVTEIVPKLSSFFDYTSKYAKGGSDEITPANLKPAVFKRVQETASFCHRTLGCGGMSRTDMILVGDIIHFLEINTIPGMTEMSLFPQALRVAGIPFPEFLTNLIALGLWRNHP